MNREQRRAALRAGIPPAAITYAESYRCPDCSATTDLHLQAGVPVLDVRHDPTCPALAARHAIRGDA